MVRTEVADLKTKKREFGTLISTNLRSSENSKGFSTRRILIREIRQIRG